MCVLRINDEWEGAPGGLPGCFRFYRRAAKMKSAGQGRQAARGRAGGARASSLLDWNKMVLTGDARTSEIVYNKIGSIELTGIGKERFWDEKEKKSFFELFTDSYDAGGELSTGGFCSGAGG